MKARNIPPVLWLILALPFLVFTSRDWASFLALNKGGNVLPVFLIWLGKVLPFLWKKETWKNLTIQRKSLLGFALISLSISIIANLNYWTFEEALLISFTPGISAVLIWNFGKAIMEEGLPTSGKISVPCLPHHNLPRGGRMHDQDFQGI
ncbi:MAG: hypothetical protein D6785_08555 [Planctomycetota bacterium]|nr:MAG: hypothetical protein D6785_08555 [Planctomycetota bacterium]